MELFDAVAKRYSHKALFAGPRVPKEDLRKIVEAGMAAPSAGNNQSPEFVLVDEPEVLAKLGEITDSAILASAPVVILILSRPRIKETLDISTECLICDFAASAQNMLLAATGLGYLCAWLDGPLLKEGVQAKMRELFGIPDDRIVPMCIPLGHEGEVGARREKKPFEQRASWNRYKVIREA